MIGELFLGKCPTRTVSNFWKKVAKAGPNECWLWIGSPSSSGYGSFAIDKKTNGAHRVSWIIHYGEIENGAHVLHDCPNGDNKLCVNPLHLYLGTSADNARDRKIKGQAAKGDRHGWVTCPDSMNPADGDDHWSRRKPELVPRGEDKGSAKLTEDQVISIRELSKSGEMTQREIACLFKISQPSVAGIVLRKTWSHV